MARSGGRSGRRSGARLNRPSRRQSKVQVERPRGSALGDATRVDTTPYRRRIERTGLVHAASWLTDRDDRICLDLYEHKLLTTPQISDLYFTDERRARKRLIRLYRGMVVNRFRPPMHIGSAPYHYILDELGAHVVAARLGLDMKHMRKRLEYDARLPKNPRLEHLVEANEFFVTLIAACRGDDSLELTTWWGERTTADHLSTSTRARPDGLGRLLAGPDGTCTFLFELDRGTERGDRLEGKVFSYAPVFRGDDAPDALLFLFPTKERERWARRKLELPVRIVIATSYAELYEGDPLGRVWLPVRDERRVSLLELPRRQRL